MGRHTVCIHCDMVHGNNPYQHTSKTPSLHIQIFEVTCSMMCELRIAETAISRGILLLILCILCTIDLIILYLYKTYTIIVLVYVTTYIAGHGTQCSACSAQS